MPCSGSTGKSFQSAGFSVLTGVEDLKIRDMPKDAESKRGMIQISWKRSNGGGEWTEGDKRVEARARRDQPWPHPPVPLMKGYSKIRIESSRVTFLPTTSQVRERQRARHAAGPAGDTLTWPCGGPPESR
ncbi:hypothetical protein NL676_028902 [Syzygium grande]|nr:hypothetical protein NL676_028902 [Syzygium grande]